jgi:hypothetical protein
MALSPVETELLGRVKRAAITLRCLPVDARLKPMGLRSVWPEMKREMAVIYGDTRRAAGPVLPQKRLMIWTGCFTGWQRCRPRHAACCGRAPMACGGRSYVR